MNKKPKDVVIIVIIISIVFSSFLFFYAFSTIATSQAERVDGSKWYTRAPARSRICENMSGYRYWLCWWQYRRTPNPIATKPSRTPRITLTITSTKTLTPTNLPYPIETATNLPYPIETSTSIPYPTPTDTLIPSTPTRTKTPIPSNGLGIGYSFSPSFVDYFNYINLPTDYVAVGLSGLDTINTLRVGQKVLMFSSITRLKEYPENVFSKIDAIGFDLERGAVPAEEQADLVGTVQEASEFAKEKNLKLLIAPVAYWTEQFGESLVPYADIIVMQMMRYQSDPILCPQKTTEFSKKLRAANPNIEIFVQLSTQRTETPEQLYACYNTARNAIDGAWIQWHYRDDGGPKEGPPNFEELEELISLIRPYPPYPYPVPTVTDQH